jgi:hypothetical protein
VIVRWFERIAFAQLAALLFIVHAIAICVWQQSGAWPRYKSPTSWSVSPIADHTFLFDVAVLWVLCNLGIASIMGAWSLGRAGFLLMHRGHKQWRAIGFYALILASVVVFWTDPVGALNWFAD